MSTSRFHVALKALKAHGWYKSSSFKDTTYAQAVCLLTHVIQDELLTPIPKDDEVLTKVSNATRVDCASLMLYAQETVTKDTPVTSSNITTLYPALEALMTNTTTPYLPMNVVYHKVNCYFLDLIIVTAARYLDIHIETTEGSRIVDEELGTELRNFTNKCIRDQKFFDQNFEHSGDPLVAWTANSALIAMLGSTASQWISDEVFPVSLKGLTTRVGEDKERLSDDTCIKAVIQFALTAIA